MQIIITNVTNIKGIYTGWRKKKFMRLNWYSEKNIRVTSLKRMKLHL